MGMPTSSRRDTGSLFAFVAGSSWFADTPSSTWSTPGPASDNFGTDVTTGSFLGELGLKAVAVGAPYAPGGGQVAVFRAAIPLGAPIELTPSDELGWSFGSNVQAPGDFDADGTDDLVVSREAVAAGRVYVYFGPVSLVKRPLVIARPSASPGTYFGGLLY